MIRRKWTAQEIAFLKQHPSDYDAFCRQFGPERRTKSAWWQMRDRLGLVGNDLPPEAAEPSRPASPFERFIHHHLIASTVTPPPLPPEPEPEPATEPSIAPFTSDKKTGSFDWRAVNQTLTQMQAIRHEASFNQTTADIRFDVDHPIAIIALSDAHLGSWASDYTAFQRITDEILSTPNLYVALLGDLQEMAIKLRGVAEVTWGSLLPPELQDEYILSWLNEIEPRILFSTWDNHSVQRQESQAGSSIYARLMNRRVVYFNGIGHPNITVGSETYRMAVAHHFMGRSIYNPTHGIQRYLTITGHDREIGMAGDSHVPGILTFMHGGVTKLAINSGHLHVSGYQKRFFSIYDAPIFPVLELHPDKHVAIPFWNLDAWQRATGRRAA